MAKAPTATAEELPSADLPAPATAEELPSADLPAPGTAVATTNTSLPAFLGDDLANYAGAGVSTAAEDNVLPFLSVLQKNSPQVNKREADYIPGAEAGMIFNTATRELFHGEGEGAGIMVLHAYFLRTENEWVPRSAGGGYVATHPATTPLLGQVKEVPKSEGNGTLRVLPNGNQLVTTANHLVIVETTLEPANVALTSTGLQVSRQWNTLMRQHKVKAPDGTMVVAPSFARRYRLRTVYRSNSAGDWYVFAVDDCGWVGQAQMQAYNVAKEFFRLAQEGNFRLGRPPAEGTATETMPTDDKAPL